jgi:hypothetical protein
MNYYFVTVADKQTNNAVLFSPSYPPQPPCPLSPVTPPPLPLYVAAEIDTVINNTIQTTVLVVLCLLQSCGDAGRQEN